MDEYQNEIQYYNVNGFGNISNYFHNGAVIIETINFKTAYIFKKWLKELNDELLDIVCNSDLHNKPKVNIRRKELARRNRSVRRKERLFENNMRNNEYHRKLVDNGVVSKDLYIKTYINEHKSRRTIKHTLNTDFFKYILDNFKGVEISKDGIFIIRNKEIDDEHIFLTMNEILGYFETDDYELIENLFLRNYDIRITDKHFNVGFYGCSIEQQNFDIINAYKEASKTLKDRRKEKLENLKLLE